MKVSRNKQYCVTVKVYTFAENKEDAINQVMEDLDYHTTRTDSPDTMILGYINPTSDSVEEIEEDEEDRG
jgi:hypothetical protein